ncbi:MAG TPA: hypothetical protein PKE07_09470 [Lacibacter sp.]|nr:hypothetical protein [Lacibacter sp.]HMO89426.1 hypothetical protein [Lacibacter sp.]
MKAKLYYLFIPALFLAGCKKDNYETRPRLEIKSVKVQEVIVSGGGNGTIIEIDFNVLDKEGDVKDSIFIQKVDAATIPCPGNSILSNLNYRIPDFPGNNQKSLFRLRFATIQLEGYTLLGGTQCPPRRDTSLFRFWVKDAAGNVSDTVQTEPLAIPR